jgi:hypothetical protein
MLLEEQNTEILRVVTCSIAWYHTHHCYHANFDKIRSDGSGRFPARCHLDRETALQDMVRRQERTTCQTANEQGCAPDGLLIEIWTMREEERFRVVVEQCRVGLRGR